MSVENEENPLLLTWKGNKSIGDYKVVCDQPLFNFSTYNAREHAERYIASLKNLKGTHNTFVSEIYIPTWEKYYPNPLERLLAIEAVEKFGSFIHTDNPDNKPDYIKGYPYHLHTKYLVESNLSINDPDYYREWFEDKNCIPDKESISNCTITEHYSWKINDPTGVVLFDMSITPIKPIQYLTLSATVTQDNCSFKEV